MPQHRHTSVAVIGPPRASSTTVRDLDDRAQIHDVVVAFYREIVFDDLLGPLFDEVAETDWVTHIPKLIDYWCRVLLGQPGYNGMLLAAHKEVSDLERFRPEHFDRWYALWDASIDSHWAGPVADKAKSHAAHMAAVMAHRLIDADWAPAGGA